VSSEVMAPLRAVFADLAAIMKDSEAAFTPKVEHYRAKGLYGRWAEAPAGSCIVTYVHKIEHLTVILQGTALVIDQEGNRTQVTAPGVFVTKPGTQRTLVSLTDVIWMTVHPDQGTTDQDNDRMEEVMCCKTFQEYEDYVAALPPPEAV
jgi:hypothetical protein